MRVDIEALEQNKTWLLVDIPPNIKPIGCKCVYKLKHRPYISKFYKYWRIERMKTLCHKKKK